MREGGRTPSPKASPLLTLPTFGLRPHQSLERITRDCPRGGGLWLLAFGFWSLSRVIPTTGGISHGMASGVRVSEFDKQIPYP